ncbi:MAG: DUF72 domain-containing protein [Bacteroidetes bacterium]|nr:DUF72 domain-containing protein [Bacteroidota bacterium]
MKFGNEQPLPGLDLTLPLDHPDTIKSLSGLISDSFQIYTGLPKWGKSDLLNFYPKGTSNPLLYYSNQLNAIEFNAFFYRIFPPEQVAKWRDNTSEHFTFFPKISQSISQFRRLKDVDLLVDQFLESVYTFGSKLGTCFLQMHPTFSPSNLPDLKNFVENWPKDIPLAVELRHPDWHSETSIADELFDLLFHHQVTHIITDTVGRRDMIHMRLTTPRLFVRFTAANNDAVDIPRIHEWVTRIKKWQDQGLQEVAFFGHIQAEKEDVKLLRLFSEQMKSHSHSGKF